MTVSVLLPYRDAAPTLADAVASALADLGPDDELLAVDDASSDEGPAMIASLARRDGRVRALQAEGRGLVAALETARRRARSPLLARMDADDLTLPGRFGAQRAALEAAPTLAAVGARVELFTTEGHEPGEGMRHYVAWMNGLESPADHRRELFVESPLCHPSVMLRADVLDALGGYADGDFPEDYELWLRLDAAGHALAKLPTPYLRWRQHPGQTTFHDPRYRPDAFRQLKARYLARRLAAERRPLTIWGAGPIGRRLARALEAHDVYVARFVDIDPRKIGRKVRGAPITDPSAIDASTFTLAAVGSRGARALIRAALEGARLVEGRDFLCVA
ncbi:MAG: glycosyltransferase [Myxococcales bacterium]|nr:glycosyltransferase [Myxococcales bacterium]